MYLKKHPNVRELFENRWLRLFILDATGRLVAEYAGGLSWRDVPGEVPGAQAEPVPA